MVYGVPGKTLNFTHKSVATSIENRSHFYLFLFSDHSQSTHVHKHTKQLRNGFSKWNEVAEKKALLLLSHQKRSLLRPDKSALFFPMPVPPEPPFELPASPPLTALRMARCRQPPTAINYSQIYILLAPDSNQFYFQLLVHPFQSPICTSSLSLPPPPDTGFCLRNSI